MKELQRLKKMMPQTAEAAVIRTYLDTFVSLPWNKRSRDVLDLAHAEEILHEDHYDSGESQRAHSRISGCAQVS